MDVINKVERQRLEADRRHTEVLLYRNRFFSDTVLYDLDFFGTHLRI